MPPHNSRTVFVANIPYDVSEEQIANVFSEVGPVSNVEIKFDPNTGRSRGYAFVQFYDEATAGSAVRNLQDVPINGRPVRVELSADDASGPPPRRGAARPAAGGAGGFGRPEASPPRFDGIDMKALPPGQEPLPGQKATDAISKTLAGVNPGQMQEVMAGMKQLIATHPDQARQLLAAQPQLSYALFQAMLLMNIVDPSVLQRIQPLAPTAAPVAAGGAPGHASPYPPPAAGGGYPAAPPFAPPPAGFRPPPPPAAYGTPPPAAYGGYPPQAAAPPPLPASTQAALASLPEDQRTMLVQVLQLTPDQVRALDPTQQASVRQLREQFLGPGA